MNNSAETYFSPGWLFKPDAWTVATALSSAVDRIGYREMAVLSRVGTIGSSATVDLKITEADASGGTYTDVTGAAIVQAVATDDEQRIRLRLAPRKRFLKGSLTVGVATSDYAAAYVLYEPDDTQRAALTWVKV